MAVRISGRRVLKLPDAMQDIVLCGTPFGDGVLRMQYGGDEARWPFPEHDGYAMSSSETTAPDVDLQALIETAVARQNDVLIITTFEGTTDRIVYANPAIFQHSGYSVAEVVGNTPRMFQGPDTSRATLRQIRAALDARRPVRAELLNYCKNGAQYWTELDISPIFADDGTATHMVSVQRDITERRRNLEAVQRSDRRFRTALKASANAIWEWDITTDDVEYRDEIPGLSWHGQHHGNTTGKGLGVLLDKVHPDDRDRIQTTIKAKIAENDFLQIQEYRLRRPDGSYADVSDRQFILRDRNRVAERVIGSILDVSEKRELENRRNQAQRLELLGEMTGGVAHNFNNLLTVILGSIDRLRNAHLDGETDLDVIQMIDEAAQRGAALTEHLMSFSQAKAPLLESVDVDRLIGQVSPVWRNLLSAEISLSVQIEPGLWPVCTDQVQLEAAILNLVINARDAMPRGGDLRVEAENIDAGSDLLRAGDLARYVKITVADTGVGMPPEHVKVAFDPFFTTKAPGLGTGLGLSSAHGFMSRSGGFIRLQSTPGKGTTVSLFLLASQDQPEPEFEAPTESIPSDGGHCILIVEDDPLVSEYVQALLISLKFQVKIASNGEDALRLLVTGDKVNLLFTDILMEGGMSGWELARSARALMPDLPILFTSAFPDAVEPPSEDLTGIRNLLRKPYRSHDLSVAILATLAAAEGPPTKT